MNFIQQQHGYDFEPTACIDADRAAVRQIEADLADFLTKAKARIADLECAETKRMLEDFDDCIAVVRSDCLSGAADELERALSERDEDGRASYWRGLNHELRRVS